MSPYTIRLRYTFPKPAKIKVREGFAVISILLGSVSVIAQQLPTTVPQNSPDKSAIAETKPTASVPAGTRIGLVLTQPIQTRYIHRGDDIYAQITSPVTSGSEVVIPPGSFVQGKIDKIQRDGGRGELRLQSLSISFPDGYVANVAGPITMETDYGYAIKDPGKGRLVGAFALPAAGLGLGALIGHAAADKSPQTLTSANPPGCTGGAPFCASSSLTTPADTLKSTAIGSMVGLAAGGVASLVLIFGTHNFFLEAGAPVSLVLLQPIVLPEDEAAAAIRDAQEHPATPELIPPLQQFTSQLAYDNPGVCWTPGSPGTLGIDIPGTPALGNSPGAPPTHPGTLPTFPTPYPCP